MKILITGAAGFIGMHLCYAMINSGYNVVGIDNLNDYYDINLKIARLKQLGILVEKSQNEVNAVSLNGFRFIKMDINDFDKVDELFSNESFNLVIHLAAQAGVRYSVENPRAYINTNIGGFFNILDLVYKYSISRFIYASSSSVYGLNTNVPFSTQDKTDSPASLYAATKKANELMAHSYSHLFGIPTMGVRFFSVYGAWGRPDMALFKFTRSILEKKPIEIYNNGDMLRDFTFIDDVVGGLTQIIENKWPETFNIQNIGRSESVNLMDFVLEIEKCTGVTAMKEMKPLQQGDVTSTLADVSDLKEKFNYAPSVSVKEGVRSFVEWYMNYYK